MKHLKLFSQIVKTDFDVFFWHLLFSQLLRKKGLSFCNIFRTRGWTSRKNPSSCRAEPIFFCQIIWVEPKQANIFFRKRAETSQARVVSIFHKNSKNNLVRTWTYIFFSFLNSQFNSFLYKKFSSFLLAEPRANDNLARAKTRLVWAINRPPSHAEPEKSGLSRAKTSWLVARSNPTRYWSPV